MRRVCTLCVLCLSMTSAVAWGSTQISRKAATQAPQVDHSTTANQLRPSPNITANGASATLTSLPFAVSTFVAMAISPPVLLGDQTIQTTKDVGQGTSEAFGYTASVTGTATSITVYLDSTDGVQLGLYTDNSRK